MRTIATMDNIKEEMYSDEFPKNELVNFNDIGTNSEIKVLDILEKSEADVINLDKGKQQKTQFCGIEYKGEVLPVVSPDINLSTIKFDNGKLYYLICEVAKRKISIMVPGTSRILRILISEGDETLIPNLIAEVSVESLKKLDVLGRDITVYLNADEIMSRDLQKSLFKGSYLISPVSL